MYGRRERTVEADGKRDDTTIAVKRRTKRRMSRLKVHPRETDDETVNRALDALRGELPLLPPVRTRPLAPEPA